MARTIPRSWSRVVLSSVHPQVDGGRWPIKRLVGETVDVVAGLIIDGHDLIAGEVEVQFEDEPVGTFPLKLRYNDEYVAAFPVEHVGSYTYQVHAWVDRFGTWQDRFRRRVKGGDTAYEINSELQDGAGLLEEAAAQAKGDDKKRLKAFAKRFKNEEVEAGLSDELLALARRYDPRRGAIHSDVYTVHAEPELARFAAWYEFFPRSAPSDQPHATLDDAAELLPRIKELGFDIVYLPPVHPIGRTNRKGKDNATTAAPGDVGSPWAIGAKEGGHKAVHPDLGGIEAFDRFVERAEAEGLKVAIDIAFQTSPDHPYIKDHPSWFQQRPDGSIRYAENPPKKYQDVHPFDFESKDWEKLWEELKSVFSFWIDHGVTIFRVDNPHTKPLAFWEWCIRELREKNPELIFLSEAFTKPKMMYGLAKLGFNNSYTYFTWRNTKEELQSYAEELFLTDVADFFRPNFWPNTPDILTDYLVHGGRPAHVVRFVLAATLSSAYGVYGPPYEHVDNQQHPDREEYSQNEKYELRTWNWRDSNSLQPLMKRVNQIRKRNPALQQMRQIGFIPVDNPNILAFYKQHEDNTVVVIANLDPHHTQSGWLDLPMDALGLAWGTSYQMHDLLGGEYYRWEGARNYVQLSPHVLPAHILRIER